MSKGTRKAGKLYTCASCKERKVLPDMRHPGSTRGKAPSTCSACRGEHPAESWCDHHTSWHPVERFRRHGGGRPGFLNDCREARSFKVSQRKGSSLIRCVSCREEQAGWFFRGGREKSPTCRTCQQDHPGMRWCVDCPGWKPETAFNRTGINGKFWTVRCKPCRSAHNHGTTVAAILQAQGASFPCCAACGATENLKVDHDHTCCPAERSCGRCIRGYLCHECNTAEGLLKTPERASMLAAYMARLAVT